MKPEAGKLIAGKYRLERPLAVGGMGAVWVARHLELDVELALKFILDEEAEPASTSRARFKREAQAAAKLKSVHVTQIHDYGVEEGTPYMAMELLEGEDLASRLARKGRLSLQVAAEIVDQVCRGLQAAHDAGIVHRDIKPSNIFLAVMDDGREVVKILDFGIAKVLGVKVPQADRTKSGMMVGSPSYMSPEQLQGDPVDHHTDLWSLAVVIFELISGEQPFHNEHLANLISAICTKPLPLVSERMPALKDHDLDRFFSRALARVPESRLGSAKELSEAFNTISEGRPMPEAAVPSTQRCDRSFMDGDGPDGAAHSGDDATLRSPDMALADTAHRAGDTSSVVKVITAPIATERRRASRSKTVAAVVAGGVLLLLAGWFLGRTTDRAVSPAASTSGEAAAATTANTLPSTTIANAGDTGATTSQPAASVRTADTPSRVARPPRTAAPTGSVAAQPASSSTDPPAALTTTSPPQTAKSGNPFGI